MNNSDQFEIKSELSKVKLMASHFRIFCDLNQIDEHISSLLELAFVEALNNIIIHAYDGVAGFNISSKYQASDSELIITIIDFGKKFSKEHKEIDSSSLIIEELAEGSWGLDLINSISDEVIRLREHDKNILIIKKNISI